ncbi:Catenin alpha-3 [Varanus komodoensis]|nr:Catenin alpha-3 [Varanus komodoensis]
METMLLWELHDHLTSEALRITAKKFTDDPCYLPKREAVVQVARALLAAVTRLLILADMIDVSYLLQHLTMEFIEWSWPFDRNKVRSFVRSVARSVCLSVCLSTYLPTYLPTVLVIAYEALYGLGSGVICTRGT